MIGRIEDIEAIRPISKSIPADRILTYIREAEEIRIIPAISIKTYNQLNNYVCIASAADEDYETLLNGGIYGDKKENLCYGLRKSIAYLAYSRMVIAQQINVTAFGVVNKQTDVSQIATHSQVKAEADMTQKVGEQYLYSCVKMLKNHKRFKLSDVIRPKYVIVGE